MRGKTMAKRHGFTAIWMAATMLLVGQTARAQNGESFKARLSPVPIDVAMMSTVAGSGSLTALLAGNKLTLTGSFEGLRSPATDAHIHRAPKGIRGPAILDLAVTNAASRTISGSLERTPALVEDVK